MLENKQLDNALGVIRSGGIIAYPTESIFGLGCDPFSQNAVLNLLALKNRPIAKGLIVVASNIRQLLPLIKPKHANDLARALKTWPGHNTWVFPKSELVPSWLSGKHDSVAIRLSLHPVVVQLCDALNHGLVSTSANIAKQAPLDSINLIKSTFSDKIQLYIDAPLGTYASPSPIRDAHTLQIIR